MRLAGNAGLVAMPVFALPASAGPWLIRSRYLESFERQLGDQVIKNA